MAFAAGRALTSASPETRRELRAQFDRQHYLRLPGFFDGELLRWIVSELSAAEFKSKDYEGIGAEWYMQPNRLGATLTWLLNSQELLQALADVTGADDIAWFNGRVYRLDPPGQSFDWHDDVNEDRRLALSVNLTEQPYGGGVLRIREQRAPEAYEEVPNPGLGDAVLFRVARGLQHCVTPVTGTVPRVSYTGWFMPGPSYYSALMGKAGQVRDEAA